MELVEPHELRLDGVDALPLLVRIDSKHPQSGVTPGDPIGRLETRFTEPGPHFGVDGPTHAAGARLAGQQVDHHPRQLGGVAVPARDERRDTVRRKAPCGRTVSAVGDVDDGGGAFVAERSHQAHSVGVDAHAEPRPVAAELELPRGVGPAHAAGDRIEGLAQLDERRAVGGARARGSRRACGRASSSRTAVRSAPVPRPWTTRTLFRPGEARRRRRTRARPRAPPAPACRARRAGRRRRRARSRGRAPRARRRAAVGAWRGRAQPRERDPHAQAARPSTSAVRPRSRRSCRGRPRRAPRPGRRPRAAPSSRRGRRARSACSVRLRRARRPRRGGGRVRLASAGCGAPPPLALATAGRADLLAQRLELGRAPRRGRARPPRARGLARLRGRGAHLLDLRLELGLACAPRARRAACASAARARPRSRCLGRAPLGLLGLGQQLRRAQPLRLDPRARVVDDGRRRARAAPAICSACDVPGRPSASR